jgi:subtilisin-like proprotein convertase family protein
VVDTDSCADEYPSADVPKPISDYTTVNSTIAISQSGPIMDINVRLNIIHTYDADLDVFLIGPDATRVELFTDVGGGSNNFTDTVIDDEAATAITSGAAPFTGTYRPEGSLAVLDGKNFTGTWTLEIRDDAGGDTGALNSWSLIIETTCNIADFDEDGDVDTDDLGTLCASWLTDDAITDIAPVPDGDGIVDMMDFAVFAENWLEGTSP